MRRLAEGRLEGPDEVSLGDARDLREVGNVEGIGVGAIDCVSGAQHPAIQLLDGATHGAFFGWLSCPAHPRPPRSSHHDTVGWNESELMAHFDDLPPALVNEAVVVIAEGKEVGQVARPALSPELDVMGSRPVDRPVAAWPAAAAISRFERPALGRRDGSRRPPDV